MTDFRDTFAEGADQLAQKALDVLAGALDRKKKYRVSCPKCKANFAAPFPDFNAIAKAVEVIRDSGKGKPPQAKTPVEEKPLERRKLEDMTDEELLALLNPREDTNGETDSSSAQEAAR